MYNTNRLTFLERDLVGLCMNGNWQVWVRCCGGEAVSIHMVRKHYAHYTEIGRLSSWTCSSMGSDWVSELGAGAGERVGSMVNGTSLISGSIAGLGACGDRDSVSKMSWRGLGDLQKVTEGAW